MSDINVMKLRERCVDMALRLHPVPKLDDVLATARILFEYISPAVATRKRSPNGTFDRTKHTSGN